MEFDKSKVREYILSKSEIEVSDTMEALELTYPELQSVIDELVQEGELKLAFGFTYDVVKNRKGVRSKKERKYTYKNYDEDNAILVLWVCIKVKLSSFEAVRKYLMGKCEGGIALTARSLDWLEERGFISKSSDCKVKISAKEYIKRFGNPKKRIKKFRKDKAKNEAAVRKKFAAYIHKDDSSENNSN